VTYKAYATGRKCFNAVRISIAVTYLMCRRRMKAKVFVWGLFLVLACWVR